MKNEYNRNNSEIYDIQSNDKINEYTNVSEYGPLEGVSKTTHKEYSYDTNNSKNTKASSTTAKAIQEKVVNVVKVVNITAIATGFTAVVIGGGIIMSQLDTKEEEYNINFNAVETSENMIFYDIDVGDAFDLVIKIYNDGYEYVVSADSGQNVGEVRDLQDDTEYKVAVCKDEVIEEISVKTMKSEYQYTTPLEEILVEYECKCNVDGYFHFTIYFEDTEGVYTDFEATLEDMDGNISKCEFVKPYNSEQIISIENVYSYSEAEVLFRVTCKVDGEEYVLFEEYVMI